MRTLPFVWEIGCEEFPAAWVPDTLSQLGRQFEKQLEECGLEGLDVEVYGTLRRLVVHVPKLPDKPPNRREEVTGPPARIAKTETGEWSKAATGFARKNKLDPAKLTMLSTAKGEYVGFVREVKGQASAKLLPSIMAETLRSLGFPKFMNWDAEIPDGRGAFPFGRPIRWMVCLLGRKVVPFEIHGEGWKVRAGNKSQGHRFLAPQGKKPGAPFVVTSFRDLRGKLKKHFVLLNPDERRGRLENEIQKLEKKAGAKKIAELGNLTPRVLADLVEWPGAVLGTYPKEFTVLPEDVRYTVLIHHQKYIPLKKKPAFIAVTNMPSDRKGFIRMGSERVVVARLADAKFFWDEDLKKPFENRIEQLDGVLFHQKLGSYRDKVNRLLPLATWLVEKNGASPAVVERAVRLAKCDLTTEMVKEFPELQGVMGGLYAREQGEAEEICAAVGSHYQPQTLEGKADFPANAAGTILSLADKLDTLAGMFSVGVLPTGARDPFGLRRQALGVIRMLLEGEGKYGLRLEVTLRQLLDEALAGVRGQLGERTDAKAADALYEFFTERLRYVFSRDFRYDEIGSVFALGALNFSATELESRLSAVAGLRGSDDFEALSVAFKRVRNILSDQQPGTVDPEAFAEDGETELWSAFKAVEPRASDLIAEGQYGEALRVLSGLRPQVDTFFDKVLVMTPDRRLRENRLALLQSLQALFTRVADLSEIVTGPGPGSS
jgi:glycyl-tRNA synthetase beta chain